MLRLIEAVSRQPWAVLPDTANIMALILSRWALGAQLGAGDMQAAIGAAPEAADQRRSSAVHSSAGGVEVIPVFGLMAHRAHMVSNVSGPGMTSTEWLSAKIDRALADDSVGAIVLDIDSPGGSVSGTQELAEKVFSSRGRKPIVAVANSLAASAAYWIGSAANEFVATPSGSVGSIGVLAMHVDRSAANERDGVKTTYITAGKYKAEGNADAPLDDAAVGHIQTMVNAYYDDFTRAVARHRGVSADVVRKDFGEGRTVLARDAAARGMIDRVDTLENTICRMQSAQSRRRMLAAESQLLDLQ